MTRVEALKIVHKWMKSVHNLPSGQYASAARYHQEMVGAIGWGHYRQSPLPSLERMRELAAGDPLTLQFEVLKYFEPQITDEGNDDHNPD